MNDALSSRRPSISLLTDIRFLQIAGQIIFLILVGFALSALLNSIFSALASRDLTPNFAFMQSRAGFQLADAGSYTPNDSYWAAFGVGLRNTLSVVIAGLAGATILGILVGVFLLSGNWLVRNISRVYVEILRNTPLLVQIFVVFFVFVLSLPIPRESIQFPPEGILPIPIRYAAYPIAFFIGWRITRRFSELDWQRLITFPFILSTIVWIELGFAFSVETLTIPFVIVAVVLIALTVAVWRRDEALRMQLLGIWIGQIFGAILVMARLIPDAAIRVELYPWFYLNNRGFYYPLLIPTARFAVWALFVVIGIVIAVGQYIYFGRLQELAGEVYPRTRNAVLAIVGFVILGWLIVGAQPTPPLIPVMQDDAMTLLPPSQARANGLLTFEDELQITPQPLVASLPAPRGLRFDGGTSISPGYIALLIALVIYTSAFIAEIVRAGILAVPRGQLEASRALGLSYGQTLRMVILPQALRVIIPPLGNQYLNLAKNSSLAIAIAYPDIYAVMGTVINQSGQPVTGITIIMGSYLIISLLIAALMNNVNRRFQIVTR